MAKSHNIEVKEKRDYKGTLILDTGAQVDNYITALKKQVDEVVADPSKYKPMGTISVMPQKDKLKYIRYCFSLVEKFLNLSPAKLKKLRLFMELRLMEASPRQIAHMAKVTVTRAEEQEKEFIGLIQQAVEMAGAKGTPLFGGDIGDRLTRKKKIVI